MRTSCVRYRTRSLRRCMAAERRQHPSLSDVALALATRRSDPLSKVSLSLNAKGDVQIEVDVTDPDPKAAAQQELDLLVVGICPQCSYDLTGDDPERDERERRDTLGGAERPQEGTEA